MIAKLTAFALTYWKFALILIAVAGLCSTLGYCEGKKAGRAQMQLAIERANTAFLQQKARADELAAGQRLRDQRATDNLERNLADAVANIPDSVPSARRIARGCAQLRSQGVDTTALPQCR